MRANSEPLSGPSTTTHLTHQPHKAPARGLILPRPLTKPDPMGAETLVGTAAQVVVLGMAVGGDQEPALHRLAGQVEGPDARLTLDRLDGVGGQPHD
jgi:hypothetical protein